MKSGQMGAALRIRQLQKMKSTSIQEFSDQISIPKGTIEKFMNSPRLPNQEFLVALTDVWGISASWVLTGNGPLYLSEAVDDEAGEPVRNFIPIPRLAVDVSAGHGAVADDEANTGVYAFNKDWLQRRGLQANALAVVAVKGDSMEPELWDGDLILVDHSAVELIDSRIYAVRFSNDLYVKRVQQLPGGKLHLISKNNAYPPIIVEHPIADGVEVVGRVVASMHEW